MDMILVGFFAVVFLAVALYSIRVRQGGWRWWALAAAVTLLCGRKQAVIVNLAPASPAGSFCVCGRGSRVGHWHPCCIPSGAALPVAAHTGGWVQPCGICPCRRGRGAANFSDCQDRNRTSDRRVRA